MEEKEILQDNKLLASCRGPVDSPSAEAARHFSPGCELMLCDSYSEAVEKVVSGEADFAVLPVENSLSGGVLETLDLLEEQEIFGTQELLLPIGEKGDYARFIRAERRGKLPSRSVMVFLCAVCPDKPGSLLGLLKIFQRFGLNLTRIESRPVKQTFGQYRFFIEFVGDIEGERVKAALSEARGYCLQFKLLGAYN